LAPGTEPLHSTATENRERQCKDVWERGRGGVGGRDFTHTDTHALTEKGLR